MGSAIDPALLPLKRYVDFSGRSTRTELVSFWFLMAVSSIILVFPASTISMRFGSIVNVIFSLAILCPSIAVLVRRLHDQGKSGWWLLVSVPAIAINIYQNWLFILESDLLFADRPGLVDFVALASAIGVLVLALWKGEEESNGYGPNPRYDESVPY